ncbi:hypothetical protein PISMIDRAFT_89389 [Pisolithus microcarpus 441]|uniref:Uncharacterized protein n=1 Tax=Pisolithus microcarpus 441 TaxID=765257 RepID=A0A0C9ZIK1_9AGAM|nr:hypothetical protein BKA83DRAFT_89389 [Pisolithus microcarpus]KAI6034632.1 hypothetical protein BKA83DRAFT_4042884 [Pisolithus microcarpus]KIK29026.1 hypothetical protein PISMIDRAFT_89389 [Pisolithus microcarpus 441]
MTLGRYVFSDKRSSSELSEAFNSMFQWYENSKRCYAYLHDVDVSPLHLIPRGWQDARTGWSVFHRDERCSS